MASLHSKYYDDVLRVINQDDLLFTDYNACVKSLAECTLKTKLVLAYEEMFCNISGRWRVLPIVINGVSLFAVEKNGYVKKYCDTRKIAESECKKLNDTI